jgi:hypothetical protein
MPLIVLVAFALAVLLATAFAANVEPARPDLSARSNW